MTDPLNLESFRKRQQTAKEIAEEHATIVIDGVPAHVFAWHLRETADRFLEAWATALEALQSNERNDVSSVGLACQDITGNLAEAIAQLMRLEKR